jgi:hypothetical protein
VVQVETGEARLALAQMPRGLVGEMFAVRQVALGVRQVDQIREVQVTARRHPQQLMVMQNQHRPFLEDG